MALTATEKLSVKKELGYSASAESLFPVTEVFYSLNRILNELPAETETEVRTILTDLADVGGRFAGARDRLQASAVGSISLNADELCQLRSEQHRLRVDLALLIGVPLRRRGGQIRVI